MAILAKILITILFVCLLFWLTFFNRAVVPVDIPPLFERNDLSLAIVIVASVFIGFFWGAMIVWLNGYSTRSEVRRLRKEMKLYEHSSTKIEI